MLPTCGLRGVWLACGRWLVVVVRLVVWLCGRVGSMVVCVVVVVARPACAGVHGEAIQV